MSKGIKHSHWLKIVKRLTIALGCVAALSAICLGGLYCYRTSPLDYQPYTGAESCAVPTCGDSISIAVIGDSWAFRANLFHFCDTLGSLLEREGIHAQSTSVGYNGYTSKSICELLYDKDTDIHQLVETHPQYALVMCGINDQHGAYGPSFYALHTTMILRRLEQMGIRPILLELPVWDVERQYRFYSWYTTSAYKMMHLFNARMPAQSNLGVYRRALSDYLRESAMRDKIILLSAPGTLTTPDNMADYTHLNAEGYRKLAQMVCDAIAKDR